MAYPASRKEGPFDAILLLMRSSGKPARREMSQHSWNHPGCSVLMEKEQAASHYAHGPKEAPGLGRNVRRHPVLELPPIDFSSCRGGGPQSWEEEEGLVLQSGKSVPLLSFCIRVETLGTFGEEALQLVNELGGRHLNTTGDAREKMWLIQRISVAIQWGNVARVLAATPLTSKTVDAISPFNH
jgi:hypothetical protein